MVDTAHGGRWRRKKEDAEKSNIQHRTPNIERRGDEILRQMRGKVDRSVRDTLGDGILLCDRWKPLRLCGSNLFPQTSTLTERRYISLHPEPSSPRLLSDLCALAVQITSLKHRRSQSDATFPPHPEPSSPRLLGDLCAIAVQISSLKHRRYISPHPKPSSLRLLSDLCAFAVQISSLKHRRSQSDATFILIQMNSV